MNIDNVTSINNILINVNPVFFMLLAVKSFEIFPKHNGHGFIPDFFALN